MQCPSSIFVVPLVVLVSLTVEIFGGDQNTVNNLHSPMTKDVMIKLQNVVNEVEESFANYAEVLKKNNVLLSSLKAYRTAYESSSTECAGNGPPDGDDYDLIMAYINNCVETSVPTNGLLVYTDQVEAAEAQVKEIDDHLKDVCHSNPTTCEESKKEAQEKLNGVLTPEKDAKLKNEAKNLLFKFQIRLDECFQLDSAGFVDELHECVDAMNKCMTQYPK